MNEMLVTMVGNVASVVNYKETAAGVPVANFRMAASERRYDRGAGDWIDGETSWVTVVAWRWLATNLVSSLNKGDPVVVSGRLRVREWGEDDKRRITVEIDARSVGHDLARGTSAFRWAVRAKGADGHGSSTAEGPGGKVALPPSMAPIEAAVPEWIVEAVAARRASPAAANGGVEAGSQAVEGVIAEPVPA